MFLETGNPQVWLRAAGIVAIAYGLCVFWLTPSYIRMTQVNLGFVARPRTPWSGTISAACVLLFCAGSYLASRRWKIAAWPMFLCGSAIFLSIYVLGAYRFGFTVAGNGVRLVPEFELAVILIAAWGLCLAWKRPMLRSGVVAVLFLACSPAQHYLKRAWTIFPQGNPESRCEFQLARWMHDHLPGARTLASGSIRFWYDAWNDNAQAHGSSDEGILNQVLPIAVWQITRGTGQAALLWLQALGVDAVIVPDKTSQEIYHDYSQPETFQGLLSPLYDDHKGNIIYRVPRRFPALARVVERGSLPPLTTETVARYVAAIENGPDSPVTLKWSGFDQAEASATISSGQALLFQETFDPAWRAYTDGKPLRIDRDPMGFMLVDVPPGAHVIRMRFETPLENRVGWIVTGLTLLVTAGLLWRR
jgi:hypothetical protein